LPILGVCLGHQAIGAAFGANIIRAPQPIHGKASIIHHHASALFRNIPSQFKVGRYHSLIVAADNLPQELIATAYTDDNLIMALQHQYYPIYGVQFHPESILTEYGYQLLQNFLLLPDN
jgi:anthranilate synthase/aminodeoxychorismate synthase-like glutamine amidotransferase